MTIPFAVPMDIPVDRMEHGDPEFSLLEPLLGLSAAVLIVAVLLTAFFLLRRRGALSTLSVPRVWPGRSPAPEESAKQILAERLARGDLAPEDFLERASMLNWTPGAIETYRRPPRD